jgi:ribose 5-phosphate isomerase B
VLRGQGGGRCLQGEVSHSILICSADKFKGVRAALCTSTYMGRMTPAHSDSNALCLGGKCIGAFEALDILDAWLSTDYEGGRHDISLGLIEQVEDVMCRDEVWDPEIPGIQ